VTLTGAVPRARVPSYLAAMDVASLPQSADSVGLFRYTTKLSEYLSAQLPIVTGQLPFAYDLDGGWLWRLPGAAPWDGRYLEALGALMDSLSAAEVEEFKKAVPTDHPAFDLKRQQERTRAFVQDILAGQGRGQADG
jgi:hypothetical protein